MHVCESAAQTSEARRNCVQLHLLRHIVWTAVTGQDSTERCEMNVCIPPKKALLHLLTCLPTRDV